ncbi:MAG: chemotaxis protein CheW [Peptostreptococcaceae bacterium]|nr:chemotaxis protein CheW [Peptostreptococcaceae bacterium]
MSEHKYVLFRIGREEFGIDIMKVKEVTEAKDAVRVPDCPSFVEGIINLRGDVTPIINLKQRLGLGSLAGDTASHRIIVLSIEDKLVGFLVDDASQVVSIDDADIEEPPKLTLDNGKEYIEGVGKIGQKMIIILDLIRVLNEEERQEIIAMN